jgi:hypothetical protein
MQFGSWIPALHRTTRTRSHPGPRIPAIQPSSHPATQLAGSQQGPPWTLDGVAARESGVVGRQSSSQEQRSLALLGSGLRALLSLIDARHWPLTTGRGKSAAAAAACHIKVRGSSVSPH